MMDLFSYALTILPIKVPEIIFAAQKNQINIDLGKRKQAKACMTNGNAWRQ